MITILICFQTLLEKCLQFAAYSTVTSIVLTIRVNGNEPFLCLTVIQYISALTLKIEIKVKNLKKFFIN